MADAMPLLSDGLAAAVAPFVDAGVLTAGDVFIVDAVAARFGVTDPAVLLGLAFAVRAPRAGHVGVNLCRLAQQVDSETAEAMTARVDASQASPQVLPWPADLAAWQSAVLACGLVGTAAQRRPFVRQDVDGQTLVMSRRLWREQERLAQALLGLAVPMPEGPWQLRQPDIERGIEAIFTTPSPEARDAVRVAATRRLTVVTGGPGTGKTFSIKALLALLLEAHGAREPELRIELAAPTGKAAVRMAEAMAEKLEQFRMSSAVVARLQTLQPRTLHKLLGVRPDGSSRHTAENPVPADVVVVDEASMIDLTLMRRLAEAVPAHARLILLGDRDQLASVEAGTVLADIVAGAFAAEADATTGVTASVVRFLRSHRFASAPTIGHIAQALQAGSELGVQRAVRLLTRVETPAEETEPGRVQWLGASAHGRPDQAQLERLARGYLDGHVQQVKAAVAEFGASSTALHDLSRQIGWLEAFAAYRVLAVHRKGPLGVAGLDKALTARIRKELGENWPTQRGFWLGQPLLVMENAYDVGLMNGDVGLVLPTAHGLAAVFPAKAKDQDTTHVVDLVRLPRHQGALAMTVHKSQGSQFARVALVLAGRDSPIQTRELVYTGITRASERLDWLGSEAELRTALAKHVARASGLAVLLRDPA